MLLFYSNIKYLGFFNDSSKREMHLPMDGRTDRRMDGAVNLNFYHGYDVFTQIPRLKKNV